MAHRLSILVRLSLFAIASLIAFVSGAWAALALWYRLPGSRLARAFGSMLWIIMVVVLAGFALGRHSWLPWVAYVAIYAIVLLWWIRIEPSRQRNWRDDVARVLTAQVRGDHVLLDNVRNFRWRSDSDYDIRWESHDYDLTRLISADAVLSYWSGAAIAHAMISFGFDDGRHLVFSV